MSTIGALALVCGVGLVAPAEAFAAAPAGHQGRASISDVARRGAATPGYLRSTTRPALEQHETTADLQPTTRDRLAAARAGVRTAFRSPKGTTEGEKPDVRPLAHERSAWARPESFDLDVSLHEQKTLTAHQIDEKYPVPSERVFEQAKARVDTGASAAHDVERARAAIATTRGGLETLRHELRSKLVQSKSRLPWRSGLTARERAEIHFTLAYANEQLARVAEAQGASATAGALVSQAAQEFDEGANELRKGKGPLAADETRAVGNAVIATTRARQRAAHLEETAKTLVRNGADVVGDVDRLTGTPEVEVYLWSAKGQPFGHAGVAARVPGEDKLRVFDITGNASGELVVREFASREEYLYGAGPAKATTREVYSARLTNLTPAEQAQTANIASTFRSLATRSEAGQAHYRLFLGEGHPMLQQMLAPLERRVIPLQKEFASKGEIGNCARCASRALAAGGVVPAGREATTPGQLFNRFVTHHMAQDPSRVHIVDWKQAGGVPSQPREHIKRGSVPAADYVVDVDARTRTASVSKAGPDYKRAYKTRKGEVVEAAP